MRKTSFLLPYHY